MPFPAVILWVGSLLPAAAQEPTPPPAEAARADYRALLTVPTLAEKAERDRRLSFSKTSADRARARLEGDHEGSSLEERAVALMTLGCCRSRRDLSTIESAVAVGKLSVRRAAVLALGEMGEWGFDPLRKLVGHDVIGLEEALVLALIRCGEQGVGEAPELVGELARGDSTLAEAARSLPGIWQSDDLPDVMPALDYYYELRWRAAREYGFVDGRRWKQLLIDDLGHDEEFLDRVVLTASSSLEKSSVEDHLVEIVLGGGRPGALRAATYVMPEILTRLYNSGDWRPASLEEWRIILDELDDRRIERQAIDLVKAAFDQDPELQPEAGVLLFRSGADVRWNWVADRISEGPPWLQIALIDAAGDRQDPERITDLLAIQRRRPDLDVQAALTVALARLEYEVAGDRIDELIEGAPGRERDELLVALSRAAHDKRMLQYIDKALRRTDISPEIRLRLQLGYAISGRLHDRQVIRDWLATTREPSPLRRLAVRGLALTADSDDLHLLEELFPDEEDMDLNVELALALIRYRQPVALTLLRGALWDDSWNRSVLAGGILVRATSVFDLIDDLDSPPRFTTEEDLRRVGYAIGQWGGLPAVETLARRRSERDPALQGAFLGALSTRTY